MSRPLILAVGALLTLTALPREAAASCQPRLGNVAQRVSELPGETDYRLTDRLAELYDEALALEDVEPARCLATVVQMEALLAGRGAAGSSGTGAVGGAGDAAPDGRAYPGGQSAIAMRDGTILAEPEVPPVPPLTDTGSRVRPPNAFTESVVNYWTGSSVWERGRLLDAGNGYIDALREAAEEVIAAEDDEAEKRRKARAASEAIHAVEIYQHVVLVNEPEDMLAARQADALRRLRDSARRAYVQWARDELDRDDIELAPLVRNDGLELAPLTRGESQADGDDLLAPLKRPQDDSLMARIRRKISEADTLLTEEVRKVRPWLEHLGGFVEPREW